MALRLPSLYQLKKALMYPRKLYMRHRENIEPGFILSAIELHYYRPAFYKWLSARSKQEHLLHEADIDSDSLVLDVGAYSGEWAMEIVKLYNPRILAFEPDPLNYKQLLKNQSGMPRLVPYEYGLGDSNQHVRMTLEYLGSSIYSDNQKQGDTPSAEVEIRDIFDVWQALKLDRVDFMKINIEGGEFPLMERMIETNLLNKVDCYLIQFHEWHPGAYGRRRQIRSALQKTHKLAWDYHFIWEKWERR